MQPPVLALFQPLLRGPGWLVQPRLLLAQVLSHQVLGSQQLRMAAVSRRLVYRVLPAVQQALRAV